MAKKLCSFDWNLKVILESNKASEINTPVVELQLLTESDSKTVELNTNTLDSFIQKLKDALEQSKDSYQSKHSSE